MGTAKAVKSTKSMVEYGKEINKAGDAGHINDAKEMFATMGRSKPFADSFKFLLSEFRNETVIARTEAFISMLKLFQSEGVQNGIDKLGAAISAEVWQPITNFVTILTALSEKDPENVVAGMNALSNFMTHAKESAGPAGTALRIIEKILTVLGLIAKEEEPEPTAEEKQTARNAAVLDLYNQRIQTLNQMLQDTVMTLQDANDIYSKTLQSADAMRYAFHTGDMPVSDEVLRLIRLSERRPY
jgi:hypothetical protein